MGMTTTMTARDLNCANRPEFVAWAQDVSQACWTVQGRTSNRYLSCWILELVRTLSLGQMRTVIQEALTGSERTQVENLHNLLALIFISLHSYGSPFQRCSVLVLVIRLNLFRSPSPALPSQPKRFDILLAGVLDLEPLMHRFVALTRAILIRALMKPLTVE